ncbi:MAG: SPOR domain-containing protein [Arenicellales bacterium]|jgi:DedD protein
MPGRNRNEAFVLKHRLTGAAVLIGFAVIVLPLLLGAPGDGGGDQAPGAPADSDTTVFHSNITPIGGATPNARLQSATQGDDNTAKAADGQTSTGKEQETRTASAEDTTPPATKTATAKDDSSDAESKPDDKAGSRSGEKTQGSPAAGTHAKSVERGWIVQVGVFKNPDNVKKLVAKLQGSGIDSSTTGVDTSEGQATRVWVGPFETRVEAARTQVRIKRHTGSEGLIVAYP